MLGTEMTRHQEVIQALSTRCSGIHSHGSGSHTMSADERRALAIALVHCADLSAPSRPPDMAGMWARAVCEEFFQQAEREQELELELPAPAPKRADSVIWKSQVCFASHGVRFSDHMKCELVFCDQIPLL